MFISVRACVNAYRSLHGVNTIKRPVTNNIPHCPLPAHDDYIVVYYDDFTQRMCGPAVCPEVATECNETVTRAGKNVCKQRHREN